MLAARPLRCALLVVAALAPSLISSLASAHVVDAVHAETAIQVTVHAAPSKDASPIAILPPGTLLRQLEVSTGNDGRIWWRVAGTDQRELGFVQTDLLVPLNLASQSSKPADSASAHSIFSQAARSGSIEQAHQDKRAALAALEQQRAQEQARHREQDRLQRERWAEEDRQRREADAELLAWARQSQPTNASSGGGLGALATAVQQNIQQTTGQLMANQQQTHRLLAQQREQQQREQRRTVLPPPQTSAPPSRQAAASPTPSTPTRLATAPTSSTPPPPAAPAPSLGNPGKEAIQCIHFSHDVSNREDGSYYAIFSNRCDVPVFVIWCGKAPYTSDCGRNVKTFYASSENIPPGQSRQALMQGRIWYGACEGTIGFGFPGFEDTASGDYRCLPTGDFARTSARNIPSHRPRIESDPTSTSP